MLERIYLAAETVNAYGRTSRLAPGPSVDRGVAVVTIAGTLDCETYADIAAQLAAAVGNEDVSHIVLHFDSPGGMSKGCSSCVDSIAAAAAAKRITSYVSGCCCSAAFWLASQAQAIYAERTALVGSIGTYLVVLDASKLAADMGLKFHVVRAGEHKGAGVFGTEITDSQLAEFQRLVNGLNEHFLAGVAAGRRLSLDHVRTVADGRAHLAGDAVRLKLIDGVCSFEALLSHVSQPVVHLTAADRWQAAIGKRQAAGLSLDAAVKAVVREEPDLRREYVEEANAARR